MWRTVDTERARVEPYWHEGAVQVVVGQKSKPSLVGILQNAGGTHTVLIPWHTGKTLAGGSLLVTQSWCRRRPFQMERQLLIVQAGKWRWRDFAAVEDLHLPFILRTAPALPGKGRVAMTVNVSWRHALCPIAGVSVSASVILAFPLQNYLLWHLVARLKAEEPIPDVACRVLTICSQLVSPIFPAPPPNTAVTFIWWLAVLVLFLLLWQNARLDSL